MFLFPFVMFVSQSQPLYMYSAQKTESTTFTMSMMSKVVNLALGTSGSAKIPPNIKQTSCEISQCFIL